MEIHELAFPRQAFVWPGAILASVANAVFSCRIPVLAHEHSWDGNNYNVQDTQGSRGTISFCEQAFVGVFFLESSNRAAPQNNNSACIDVLLQGIPDSLRALADREACQYLLQDLAGRVSPVVTAAFWGDGVTESIAAAEPWTSVMRHGACLVRNEVNDPKESMRAWASHYRLDDAQRRLIWELLEIKIAKPDEVIKLSSVQQAVLQRYATGRDAMAACLESLAEINIRI